MNIRTRLLVASTLPLAAVAAVALAGLWSLRGMESGAREFTDSAAPMQLKALVLRSTAERLQSDLDRLGAAADGDQATRLSADIDARLNDLDSVNTALRRLAPSSGIDPAALSQLRQSLSAGLAQRQQNAALFKTALAAADAAFAGADKSLSAIRAGLRGINEQALATVASSQSSEQVGHRSLAKLDALSADTQNISAILRDPGAAADARERLGHLARAIQGIARDSDDPSGVTESIDAADAFARTLNTDNTASTNPLEALPAIEGKIASASASIEQQLAGDRQKLAEAYRTMDGIARCRDAANAIEGAVQQLKMRIHRAVQSLDIDELESAADGMAVLEAQVKTGGEQFRKGAGLLSQNRLSGQADSAVAGFRTAAEAAAKIVTAKRASLAGGTELPAILQGLAANTTGAGGENPLTAIDRSQQEASAKIHALALRSRALIAGLAAALILLGLALNSRMRRTMLRPLVGLSRALEAARRGDYSIRIGEHGEDEIARAGAALDALMDGLQRTFADLGAVAEALANGDFKRRLGAEAMPGAQAFNDSLDRLQARIDALTRIMRALAQGEREPQAWAEAAGEFGAIAQLSQQAMHGIEAILVDLRELSCAASEGRLESRIEPARYAGGYRAIAVEANALLDGLAAPLEELAGQLSALARGDLSARTKGVYTGCFARIKDDAELLRGRLGGLLDDLYDGVESIDAAASAIAQGNAELLQRNEAQSGQLRETASGVDSFGETVRQNAERAQQASRLASEAAAATSQGGAIVGGAVETMQAITDSSHRIGGIVGVIDGIAFQTNILALNAAVEAARAGEQGRGFAVVAAEVRALAQRSAAAASEIKALIAESVSNVESGSQRVGDAGKSMEAIVASIEQLAGIVREISATSREQSQGVDQVKAALSQMDQSSRHSAELLEQAARAADAMIDLSRALGDSVSKFETSPEQSGAALPKAASRFA